MIVIFFAHDVPSYLLVIVLFMQGDVVELKNVQVNDPSKLLLNGYQLTPDKLALSSVSVTAFS